MSFLRQIKSILNKNDTQPTVAETPPRAPTERRRHKRYSHKGRKILVIDDSATIVASLSKTLQSAGCLISEAADAETGLEVVRREKPDLVFLDIILPGMNGFAALRQMRREEVTREIPVIMISGNEQATEQFYAKRIGADDFMKKPFSRHEVFARIEALVAAGKLPQLESKKADRKAASEIDDATKAKPTKPENISSATNRPHPAPPTTTRATHKTANLPNDAVASMTPLQARHQLTSMGLQYFSQEQFSAAIKRGDRLAVDLFIIGGGVEIKV